MGKLFLTIVGGVAGLALAYLNRPKYLGGLLDPIKDSLASPTPNKAAMEEWLPMAITYGIIGMALGFIIGMLLENTRKKPVA